MTWALIWTAPGAESRASLHLTQQHFEHHIFRLRERCIEAGRIVWKDKNMFPRYIFARCNDMWQALSDTRGVVDVVRIGHVPAKVPDAIIDELLSRRDSDGMISIGPTQWTSKFRSGQSVRVKDGPLMGYDGVFDVANELGRVRVLLDMLGAQTPVVLSECDLVESLPVVEKKYRPRRARRRPIEFAVSAS